MFRSRSGMRQSILSFATKPNTNSMAKFQPAMNSLIRGNSAAKTVYTLNDAVAKAP
jgi:hypothetical protein